MNRRTTRAVLLLALPPLALALGLWAGGRRSERVPDLSAFAAAIDAAAAESGVDPALVRAVVAAESSGNPAARSAVGAVGLMQLMPAAVEDASKRLGIAAPSQDAVAADAALNLRLGTAYLRIVLDGFQGEETFAVAAYHAGAGNVRTWRERAPDLDPRGVVAREAGPQTRAYVARVAQLRAAYRGR